MISLKETENMKKKKKSEEAKRQGRKLQNILCCIKSEAEWLKVIPLNHRKMILSTVKLICDACDLEHLL